jgi:transposase
MAAVKAKKYTYFIGTDVSRNKLDHAVMQGKNLLFHREIKNDPAEINAFIAELRALPRFTISKAVFCMEYTGIYCNHLISCLKKVKANIVQENALHIRHSIGNPRGKYDKIDAIRIVEYAYRSREQLRLFTSKRPIIQQLAELNTLRTRLLMLQLSLTKPLKEQSFFVNKGTVKQNTSLCARSIEAVSLDLVRVEEITAELIRADERLKRLMEIITSVKSIGPITALNIVIATNEFRNINNPKKFASYAGVAPYRDDSGKIKKRARVSNLANKKMKSLLHSCAVKAKRFEPDIKAYFELKTAGEGKSKMLVLNAIRYKLILRIFACVNQDRCYETVYQRPIQ